MQNSLLRLIAVVGFAISACKDVSKLRSGGSKNTQAQQPASLVGLLQEDDLFVVSGMGLLEELSHQPSDFVLDANITLTNGDSVEMHGRVDQAGNYYSGSLRRRAYEDLPAATYIAEVSRFSDGAEVWNQKHVFFCLSHAIVGTSRGTILGFLAEEEKMDVKDLHDLSHLCNSNWTLTTRIRWQLYGDALSVHLMKSQGSSEESYELITKIDDSSAAATTPGSVVMFSSPDNVVFDHKLWMRQSEMQRADTGPIGLPHPIPSQTPADPSPGPGTGIVPGLACSAETARFISWDSGKRTCEYDLPDGRKVKGAVFASDDWDLAWMTCCALPKSDILLDQAPTIGINRCGADEVMTGIASRGVECIHADGRRQCGFKYLCSKIDTEKYELTAQQQTCYIKYGRAASGRGSATTCSQGLPSHLRFLHNSFGSDACLNLPPGSLISERSSDDCLKGSSGVFSRTLIDKATGQPVDMFTAGDPPTIIEQPVEEPAPVEPSDGGTVGCSSRELPNDDSYSSTLDPTTNRLFRTWGVTWRPHPEGRANQGNITYTEAGGLASKGAEWRQEGLERNVEYKVYVTWTEWSNRVTQSKFRVFDGESSREAFSTDINQQQPPSASGNLLDYDSRIWRELTSLTPTSGTIRVQLDAQASGNLPTGPQGSYVVADGVLIVAQRSSDACQQPEEEPAPVDCSSSELPNDDSYSSTLDPTTNRLFRTWGVTWRPHPEGRANQGNITYTEAGGLASKGAEWRQEGLERNVEYKVYVTWTEWSNRVTQSKFRVFDGESSREAFSTDINQQQPPSASGNQLDYDSRIWRELTSLTPTSGTIRVQLDAQASGNLPTGPQGSYVVADGVLIVAQRSSDACQQPEEEPAPVDCSSSELPNDDSYSSTLDPTTNRLFRTWGVTWRPHPEGRANQGNITYTEAGGLASKGAEWRQEGLERNVEYKVYVTWTEWSNRVTQSKFRVFDGESSREAFSTDINQQQPPSASGNLLDYDSRIWRELTSLTPTSGTIRVQLDAQASGNLPTGPQGSYVVADGVLIVPQYAQCQ